MKEVLIRELTLTPENEKTNLPLSFNLDEDAQLLKITYSYSPKELGDCERARQLIEHTLSKDTHGDRKLYPDYREFLPLKNLVTLSLDSPDGYCGAAHRQDSEQCHLISEKNASVGFQPCKIKKGKWTVTLNVHALVTEKCLCKIKVEIGGDGDE